MLNLIRMAKDENDLVMFEGKMLLNVQNKKEIRKISIPTSLFFCRKNEVFINDFNLPLASLFFVFLLPWSAWEGAHSRPPVRLRGEGRAHRQRGDSRGTCSTSACPRTGQRSAAARVHRSTRQIPTVSFVYGTVLMYIASENAAELAVHQHVREQDHVAWLRVSTRRAL